MRVLVVGAGGVGSAVARTVARWDLFERVVVADYDEDRARRAIAGAGGGSPRSNSTRGTSRRLWKLIRTERCDAVLNALDPRFVMPVFRAALTAGVTYLDMAMSLSRPHASEPYRQPGVKLGDEQFALAAEWERRGLLALCGIGVEPGLSDVFARYAADRLFASIDEVGVRDGANLVVDGYEFAPTFSIWTTIEECLNPPVVWERGRQWYTTEPFSEPETFVFPAGIGPSSAQRGTRRGPAHPALDRRWPSDLQVRARRGVHRRAQDDPQTRPGLDCPRSGGQAAVSPRDVIAACLPDPAGLGAAMSGLTCAGTWVSGTGKDGSPREVYLHHVVDNSWSMAEYGSQAVVWQTAINPVVALELLDSGVWSASGVLGPEALPAEPFLEVLGSHGAPWECEERTPAGR